MRKLLAVAAVVLTFAPLRVVAQERGGDAALGAISGAVVFGPLGAVAGALVGYTAGPNIAHSWGMHRYQPPHRASSSKRSRSSTSSAAPPPATRQASNETSAAAPAHAGFAPKSASRQAQSALLPTVMTPVQGME
jgi:hypothetical protein